MKGISYALVAAVPLLGSCALVLDLDASGSGGDGGSDSTGVLGSLTDDGDGGQNAISVQTSGPTSGEGSTASGMPACDGYGVFSGQQMLVLDDSMHDLEDRFSVGARVRIPDDAATASDSTLSEGHIFSRLSLAEEKGVALVLSEKNDDGNLYPEMVLEVTGSLCRCSSSVPLAAGQWMTLVAGFYVNGLEGDADAAVWLDGQRVCQVDCGDSKLAPFQSASIVGAAFERSSGFLRGDIAQLTIAKWSASDMSSMPAACTGEVYWMASFESPAAQTFHADCPSSQSVMLGQSSSPAPDDPLVVSCP